MTTFNTPHLAFIDFETTGFSPRLGHRIVEAAVITTDLEGNVIDEYETLINPLREVTASEVHRISASMLKNAPSFADVMNDLIYHLKGKTLVGHNVHFDLSFLKHELKRNLQREVDVDGVCTISISKKLLPDLPFRRLESFCEYFDIDNSFAHAAIHDCQTTLEVFKCLRRIALDMGKSEFSELLNKPFIFNEEIIPNGLSFKRDHAEVSVENERVILSSIIKRLPNNPSDEVPVQEYLNLLDEVLADRIVTPEEAEGILDLISEFGLSQSQVMDIHIHYLKNLIHVYYLDHILSDSEKRDLVKVSEILGISTDQLEDYIHQEFKMIQASEEINPSSKQSVDLHNKSICFTGQLVATKNGEPIMRNFAQSLALERGMIIKSGVSSKLDYLVTADPNSLSGKSQKAREMGVKILAEPVFWQMMRYSVD